MSILDGFDFGLFEFVDFFYYFFQCLSIARPPVETAGFVGHLLEKAGIVCTPGNGFGDPGEGYFRIALTVSKERLQEMIDRMKEIGV